jgi:hypothetical protein
MHQTFLGLALVAAILPAHATVSLQFQDGASGYAGTRDTMVRSAGASLSYGGEAFISVDGDDGSPGLQPNHGLIRFENIFGPGAGQIRPSDTILSATLTLTAFDVGSGLKVHEMFATWSESSTWAALGGGVQTDGVEASIAALASFGANNSSANVSTGPLVVDVTSSLVAMQGGASLQGWALIPFTNGTNGIDIRTREYLVGSERPLLSVEVVPVPEPGTWVLLLGGLGALGGLSRPKRNRRSVQVMGDPA